MRFGNAFVLMVLWTICLPLGVIFQGVLAFVLCFHFLAIEGPDKISSFSSIAIKIFWFSQTCTSWLQVIWHFGYLAIILRSCSCTPFLLLSSHVQEFPVESVDSFLLLLLLLFKIIFSLFLSFFGAKWIFYFGRLNYV